MPTMIDCFSGPGGLSLGFRRTGFKPLLAIEWNHETAATYQRNHPGTVMWRGDIRQAGPERLANLLQGSRDELPRIDVVAGGPPCESFSIAGDRELGDDRDDLFRAMLDIADHFDARVVIMENVKGMLSKPVGDRLAIDYVLGEFKRRGYQLASEDPADFMLDAADYLVPQHRERLFLVASKDTGFLDAFIYPDPRKQKIAVGTAFAGLPDLKPNEENNSYQSDWLRVHYSLQAGDTCAEAYLRWVMGPSVGQMTWHKAPGHLDRMIKRFEYIQPGEGQKQAADRLVANGQALERQAWFPNKLYNARNRRLKAIEPAFTVTGHVQDEMLHPWQHRALSPREAARLQSFPDDYDFLGPQTVFHGSDVQDVYEQIGDAVPPLLAYQLGEAISEALFYPSS